MSFDIRVLRSFLMVAEVMHFSRAARKLHIAQPALTAQIRQLEEAIGARLFERSNRMSGLTAAGRALVPEAKMIVERADSLALTVQRAVRGETGRLRLGIIPPAATTYVAESVRRFAQEQADVELSLRQGDQDRLLERLIAGELDLMMGRPNCDLPGLGQTQLFTEEQGVILRLDDPLAKLNPIPLNQLADRKLLLLRGNPHFGQLLLGHLLHHNVRLVPLHSADDFPSLHWMVRASLGIAPCSLLLTDGLPGGLTARPIFPAPAPLEINALWRGPKPEPTAEKLLRLILPTRDLGKPAR